MTSLYDYAILLKHEEYPLQFVASVGLQGDLTAVEVKLLHNWAREVIRERSADA